MMCLVDHSINNVFGW